MEILSFLVMLVTMAAFFVAISIVATTFANLFIRYKFTSHGIDVYIFGRPSASYSIRRSEISDVKIIHWYDIRMYSPFVVNARTRFFGPALYVRTRRMTRSGWLSYTFSPDYPESAKSILGFARR